MTDESVDAGRVPPPGDADERAILTGWLDWQRATVRAKCAGLPEVDAHRTPLPSSPLMSVAGVVAHLRWAEHYWFMTSFLGEPPAEQAPEAWAVEGSPLQRLLDEYDRQCARSREIVAAHELDQLEASAPPGLPLVSLRWIVVHMTEETARHLGHLDVLRELADGVTGH